MLRVGLNEKVAIAKTNEIMNKASESVLLEAQKVVSRTFEEQKRESEIIV